MVRFILKMLLVSSVVCFQALPIDGDVKRVAAKAFYGQPAIEQGAALDDVNVIIIEDADIDAASNHLPPAVVNDPLRKMYQQLDPLIRQYLLDEKLRHDIKSTVRICCELLVGCTQEEGVAHLNEALCFSQDIAHKALNDLATKPSYLSTDEYKILYTYYAHIYAKCLVVFSIFMLQQKMPVFLLLQRCAKNCVSRHLREMCVATIRTAVYGSC